MCGLIKIIFHTTGKELTVPHQMSLAGAVSLPVFWLAGAGAAVFWVLGEPEHSTFTLSCSPDNLADSFKVYKEMLCMHL